MTRDQFRRLALSFDGAVEGAHMGHPDFRVNNKIFATLQIDKRFAMVKLSPDQQKPFIEEAAKAFVPESGAWGRAGCTRVILSEVDEETAGEALTLAWRTVRTAPKRPIKRQRRRDT